MDELVTCSLNCQNKPDYVCDCSDKKVFLCINHALSHVLSNGNHHYTEIMKSPDPQTKIIVSTSLKDLKLKLKQDRLKIIQESSLIIKQTKEVINKSLEKLFMIEKKLDEYIYLCDTLEKINNLNSKSFIESILKLSPEDASKIKYEEDIIKINNPNFKKQIKNLFTVQETANLFDVDKFEVLKPKIKANINTIKYFKNRDLFAADVQSQNSVSQNINKNFSCWDPTCLLDDGSIFCCFKGETFIITLNNSIIPLDSSQYSYNSGLIAFEDFVYMFGGSGNASLKFSLKSKNWTTLAQYPVSGSSCVSCAFFKCSILAGDHSFPNIYEYNISNNSYAKIQLTLNSSSGKTLLATQNRAYIIEYSKNYYESGLNDINTWTSIGTANMLTSGNARHSYSLQYEDSFYFITTDYRLIQFNLKNKELKHLKTI